MDCVHLFGLLAQHALEITIVVWPVSAGLIVVALSAVLVGAPLRLPKIRLQPYSMLATYLFPTVLLLVGVTFSYDWHAHPKWVEPPDWYGGILWAVLMIHAILLLTISISAKGARLRTAVILLPGFWLSLSCGFIAAIAIAGVGL
jgi:hypothetical protein